MDRPAQTFNKAQGMIDMAVTKFNETRTFGVEIEFTNLTTPEIRQLARDLTAAGIPTEYEGYNHINGTRWKIVYDGSVRNRRADRGWELVSPPLKGHEGLDELRKALRILNRAGAKVNASCGLHVHHDASQWGIDEFKNAYRLYARMELTLDEAMPRSRRRSVNFFTRSVRDRLAADLQGFEGCQTLTELRRYFGTRYLKLNMESWWRHRTIEFRHHSGTTDAEKIVNWIVFTQLIVTRAETTRKLKVNLDARRYRRTNAWRLVAVEFALHNRGDEMQEKVKSAIDWVAGRITHFRGLEAAA